MLAYPSSEPTDKWIVDTDASQLASGAVLSQIQGGDEKVIAYTSEKFSKSETNYCTTYRELLAVIRAVKHFRHYLIGHHFTIRTDHNSLKWLMNFKETKGLVARWIMQLQEYDFTIEHRKGVEHGNADGLSRQVRVKKRRRCGREECNECDVDQPDPVCVVTRQTTSRTQCVVANSTSHEESTDEDETSSYESQNSKSDTDQSTESDGSDVDDLEGSNWMRTRDRTELRDMQHQEGAINRFITLKESKQKCPSRQKLLAEDEWGTKSV